MSFNPWHAHLKKCAASYQKEKAERATLPRRRLKEKSPDEALYVREAKEAAKEPEGGAMAPQGAPNPTISPEAAIHLIKFVGAARTFLKRHEKVTAARFAQEMGEVGDFKEALKKAGLPTKTTVASFAKAFPEFKLLVPASGGASYVSLR